MAYGGATVGTVNVDLATVDVNALIAGLRCGGLTGEVLGRAAGTAGATWSEEDIPAGALVAHVRLFDGDAYVEATPDGDDPAGDGCAYPPHAPLAIPVAAVNDGDGKLQFKRHASTDAPYTVTFLR